MPVEPGYSAIKVGRGKLSKPRKRGVPVSNSCMTTANNGVVLRVTTAFCFVAIAGMCWVPCAKAQHSQALDRFSIGIGGYYANSDTTLGIAAPEGFAAASVNLEDDLGFDSKSLSARIRADVLVGDHQGISIDYYRYHRDSDLDWSKSVDWRGVNHKLDVDVDGKLDFAFGSVAWRWWFGTDDNLIGLGVGASHYRASASLEGYGQADDEKLMVDERTGASAWAPLLQVGWRHAFNDEWRMYFSGSGVFKGGGKLQGHIYNASLGAEWLPTEHLGFAIEYGVNSIHIRQAHRHYRDNLNLELNGPSAFAYLRF